MKKIFISLIILTIAISISLSLIACDKTNDNKDEKVRYSITVNCEDRMMYDTLWVKLLDTNGNAVTGNGYLDSNHRATFSVAPGVYKVELIGPLSAYEDIPETLVSPTSLNATITLVKKGSDVNIGNKATYKVTLQTPSGDPLANVAIQLCDSAEEGGMCHPATTDENGVATLELAKKTYELHISEDQWPEGYTFDDSKYTVSVEQREIVAQFDAIGE